MGASQIIKVTFNNRRVSTFKEGTRGYGYMNEIIADKKNNSFEFFGIKKVDYFLVYKDKNGKTRKTQDILEYQKNKAD